MWLVGGFYINLGQPHLWGEPVEAAYKIKDRIHRELGFTVNIGVSNNKLLAKMAGELSKPDKVHTLFPEEIQYKMWPLPVEELSWTQMVIQLHIRMISLGES